MYIQTTQYIFPYSRTSLRPPTKIKLRKYLSAVHTVHCVH